MREEVAQFLYFTKGTESFACMIFSDALKQNTNKYIDHKFRSVFQVLFYRKFYYAYKKCNLYLARSNRF